ncbi:Uncharacterised protein [Yersinia similis]|uniref:Uncharacterized protein n=1 Tax=Yersinia similis TaxID=367190 RepID=A0A0T9RJH2_9GAMM|nr:Uncharacterised protein [Yersinia similis]CNI64264.1 Uncharacterised protein [Yersinia similis]
MADSHPNTINGYTMYCAAIAASQICGDIHPRTISTAAVQRSVIECAFAIHLDTARPCGGAIDRATGDHAIQLHTVAIIRQASDHGRSIIGQRPGDIDTGAIGGITAQCRIVEGVITTQCYATAFFTSRITVDGQQIIGTTAGKNDIFINNDTRAIDHITPHGAPLTAHYIGTDFNAFTLRTITYQCRIAKHTLAIDFNPAAVGRHAVDAAVFK